MSDDRRSGTERRTTLRRFEEDTTDPYLCEDCNREFIALAQLIGHREACAREMLRRKRES